MGTDVSGEALAVARSNAERLGLAIEFRHGDLLDAVADEAPFDLIVANLPYVPSSVIPTLSPEVRCEPRLALDGGTDGLDLIRRLVQAAADFLAPAGSLLLEIGVGQATEVSALCRDVGLGDVVAKRDLAGIERVIAARRPEAPHP
jgi:release factor glutamine methyltransferase